MESHPLKIEREARGWSQIKIAEVLGVNARTVGRWESRLAVPHPYYREQLSTLFGKTIEELGLLSETDDNSDMQVEESPIEHFMVPDLFQQESLQSDPTISEVSAGQQWLTSSLAGNFQVHEQDTQTDEENTQAHEQDTQAHEDHLFSHQLVWANTPPLIGAASFRPFSRFPWRSPLIPSIILLTVFMLIAAPLAFNKLPLHKVQKKRASSSFTTTKVQDLPSSPLYTLTIQKTDPSLLNTVQHLQKAFNAVYPQLVNRFAFDPHAAKLRNVRLVISSDLALPIATNGTLITINANWIRQHPTQIGLLTYGLTLGIEQYSHGAPSWFADGMANYARTVYGPADDDEWSVPNGVQPQDSYQQGGEVTARFLLWLEQHTRLDLVDQLNHALQIGQPFPDVFHYLTQQTVDDLWRQYQAHPDLIQTPEQLYTTVTSRKPLYQSSVLNIQIMQWHTFKPIFAPRLYMSNFAIQADMTVLGGNGKAGFVFRNENTVSYYLRVNLRGAYELANQMHPLASGLSSAIHQGLYQTNRLTIVAQKHIIYLYINGQLITKVDDSSSSYGRVGVMAIDETKVEEVRFENVQVF